MWFNRYEGQEEGSASFKAKIEAANKVHWGEYRRESLIFSLVDKVGAWLEFEG